MGESLLVRIEKRDGPAESAFVSKFSLLCMELSVHVMHENEGSEALPSYFRTTGRIHAG